MSESALVTKWSEMVPAMKRIVVHTAIMIALSVVVVFFLVLPAIKTNASLGAESAAVSDNFTKTHAKISAMAVQRETALTAEENLKALADSGVLVPLLGSLEMRAMAILAPLVATTGVTIAGDSVKSMPQRPVLDPASLRGHVYVRQPVEFSGSGTFSQIVAFIKEVEDKLPMVTLSSLRIVSQSRTPEIHAMTMSLEWPVSIENKTEKADKPGAKTGSPK